jgi:hypothetical protein
MENISITETKKGTHVTSPSKDSAHLFIYLFVSSFFPLSLSPTRAFFALSFLNKVEQ